MTKQKNILLALWIMGIVFLLVAVLVSNQHVKGNTTLKKNPVYMEYFKAGDTLLPDYICPDTLIVVDAVGYNKAMGLYEQGIEDWGDYQLDSVSHTFCKLINQ